MRQVGAPGDSGRGQLPGAHQPVVGHLRVVEVGVVGRRVGGEDARVEGSRDHDGHTAFGAALEQRQTGAVEQGPSSSEHHDIDIGLLDDPQRRLPLVHPDPDGPDYPLVAQRHQRGQRAGDRLVDVVIGVVHIDDVDAVELHPGEARLQTAPHPVTGVVEDTDEVVAHVEGVRHVGPRRVGVRLEEPADLGTEHVGVAGPTGEGGAEAALRQAEAVVRCRVVVAHSLLPGGRNDRVRRAVVHRAVEVAEVGATQPEGG